MVLGESLERGVTVAEVLIDGISVEPQAKVFAEGISVTFEIPQDALANVPNAELTILFSDQTKITRPVFLVR